MAESRLQNGTVDEFAIFQVALEGRRAVNLYIAQDTALEAGPLVKSYNVCPIKHLHDPPCDRFIHTKSL